MTLRGVVPAFPLETVVQLLAATHKTGELEIRSEAGSGGLGMAGGRLVSARWDEEIGEPALGAAFAAREGVFSFEPAAEPPIPNLSGDLDQLLDRAVEERDKLLAIRQLVPDEHARFRLSERAAARGEIRLSAEEWRALLAVDGERDVAAIAERLGMRRLPARGLVADLVRAGVVDTLEAAPGPPTEARFVPPPQATDPGLRTGTGAWSLLRGSTDDFPLDSIVQLLAVTEQNGRLDVRGATGSGALGLSTGHLVSAVWDEAEGELALGAALAASAGEFALVDRELPPVNLHGEVAELLDRGAELRDRLIEVRAVIPEEPMPFRLSARAAQRAEIKLTSEQWRALLAVDGQRDARAIATQLRLRHLEALLLLADLVREGLVEVVPEPTWPAIDRRRAPSQPAAEPAAAFVPTETVAPVAPVERPAEIEAEAVAAVPPYVTAPEPELAASVVEAPPVEVPEEVPTAFQPAPQTETAEEFAREPEVLEREPEVAEREEPLAETPRPSEAVAEAPAAPSAWEAPAWEQPTTTWEPTAPVEPAAGPAEIDPRLTAFGLTAPPAPEAPPEPAEVDPRLAAFGATAAAEPTPWIPSAETGRPPAPAEPTWTTPAATAWTAPAEPAVAPPEPSAPPLEVSLGSAAEIASATAAEAVAPPVEIKKQKKRGFPFFWRKEGPTAIAAPVAGAPASEARAVPARGRAAQLASFSNELLAEYGTGKYGKARLDERMLGRLMRVDEQADPIDRPMPVTGDRLDVHAVESELVPERQSVRYLAMLVRHIFEDAERAYGRDKARRGYREARQRVFGKDISTLQSPDLAGRLPKA